jgi:hypothetical protein
VVTKTTKTRTATAAAAPGLDWSLRPRGTASAVATAVLGMTAGAAVGDVCGLPPALGIGAGLIGMAGTVATSSVTLGTRALVWRSLVWLAGGGWTSWGLATGVWDQPQLATLALGALAAGITAPLGRAQDPEATGQDTPAAAAPGAEGGALTPLHGGGTTGATWASYIYRATRVLVTVTHIERWPNGSGFTLRGLLPADGNATIDTIKAAANVLATMARLPKGCGVEVDLGDDRGEIVLRVSTVNRMNDLISVPEDYSPLSILQPLPLGLFRDGDTVRVLLRELSLLLVGAKGSGKTNLMDLITLLLLRCTDALVWHIDMNGGGMSQLWLHPWLEGEAERPAIDWAAPNEQSAIRMVRVAMAIAKARKRSGRKLKVAANSKLLPISEDLPEIVIMVDEGKSVLAPNTRGTAGQVGKQLEEILDQARNEGVNIVASGLRATSTTISTDFRAQCGLKIGMWVEQEAELNYLFGWSAKLSLTDIAPKGGAFIQMGDGTAPRPFKAAFLPPDHIIQAAATLAPTQPSLDAASATLTNRILVNDDPNHPEYSTVAEVYAGRWKQMKDDFLALEDDDEDEDGEDAQALVPVRHLKPLPTSASTSGWADPQALRRAASAHTPAAPAAPAAQPRVVKAVRTDRPEPAPVQDVPALLAAALRAFGRDTRMHSEDLAAALGLPNKHRLAELLGALEVYPLPNAFSRGGQERRGYERKDLENAARAISEGRRTVPETVSAWAS